MNCFKYVICTLSIQRSFCKKVDFHFSGRTSYKVIHSHIFWFIWKRPQAAPSGPKWPQAAPSGPKLVSQPTMASNGFTTYNGLKRSHNLQLFLAKELNWIKTFNLSSNEKFFRFRWKLFAEFFIIRIRMNYVSTFSWCKLKVGIKKHLKKSRYHYWYLPTKVYMIGSLFSMYFGNVYCFLIVCMICIKIFFLLPMIHFGPSLFTYLIC